MFSISVIYSPIILWLFLYGCGTCSFGLWEEHEMTCIENKMLREIFICKTGRQMENIAWWRHLQFICHKRMPEWHYTCAINIWCWCSSKVIEYLCDAFLETQLLLLFERWSIITQLLLPAHVCIWVLLKIFYFSAEWRWYRLCFVETNCTL
jgi:hypothetical protein